MASHRISAPPPPVTPVTPGRTRLEVFFDLEKKELVLRFESRELARVYQNRNPEGRIFADQPTDVWLPMNQHMKTLRNGSHGMTVSFDSKEAAAEWQRLTILGMVTTFGVGTHGVAFKRDWTTADLRQRLGDFFLSPQSSNYGSPLQEYPPSPPSAMRRPQPSMLPRASTIMPQQAPKPTAGPAFRPQPAMPSAMPSAENTPASPELS